MRLTIEDAFHLIRENIYVMQVSDEEKSSMFAAIQFLESGSFKEFNLSIEEQPHTHLNVAARVCWPWDWKWFGLNKKKDFHKKMNLSVNQQDGIDLPSNVYIGAVELFAAVLIFILPVPGAQAFAGVIAADGARRVLMECNNLGMNEEMIQTIFPLNLHLIENQGYYV
jgi:hypothetical protein